MSFQKQFPLHPSFVLLFALGAFAVCAAALWKWTPAAHYLSSPVIAQLFHDIRNSNWVVPAVIGIYIGGTMVFFPLTILIIATALVFPPAEACGVALAGSLSSACLGYAVGRFSGVNAARFLKGRRGKKISQYAKQPGVLGIAILRMLPLLPLGVIDVALGMARIPFLTYLVATLLGLVPAILALSILGDSLGDLWRRHDMHILLYVGLGIICWASIMMISQSLVRYWQSRSDALPVN